MRRMARRASVVDYVNRASVACRRLGSQPDFRDLDLHLPSRRTTDRDLRPVGTVRNFWRERPTYGPWRASP